MTVSPPQICLQETDGSCPITLCHLEGSNCHMASETNSTGDFEDFWSLVGTRGSEVTQFTWCWAAEAPSAPHLSGSSVWKSPGWRWITSLSVSISSWACGHLVYLLHQWRCDSQLLIKEDAIRGRLWGFKKTTPINLNHLITFMLLILPDQRKDFRSLNNSFVLFLSPNIKKQK